MRSAACAPPAPRARRPRSRFCPRRTPPAVSLATARAAGPGGRAPSTLRDGDGRRTAATRRALSRRPDCVGPGRLRPSLVRPADLPRRDRRSRNIRPRLLGGLYGLFVVIFADAFATVRIVELATSVENRVRYHRDLERRDKIVRGRRHLRPAPRAGAAAARRGWLPRGLGLSAPAPLIPK